MSKVVDERVVSMQFDNRHFESNVKTTMSTLDRLKQSLNLKGASRGLENVGTAAKNVNMSGLGSAVETVTSKFSALQVMGVTALANITNSAVNAGKRIVSALTIEPVKDGFSEYEMTLNAIQTTMAATGKTAQEVEVELKKLDEYADKTVYGTADMLNNLPKFTNAGVDLEKATTAMIGIANATALAGGDANKASIAFYNLGQAIGTGYLTRMDYNSINNAGIATMEWKNQMVEAAIAQGTLTKVGEDAYSTGSKTLTLQQLFIDGLQDQWATTDVMMKVFSDYGDETTEIGKKAFASAQDIKTFTMMMESLKATAGTGWKDTWQIIFGDLDQAKELWTGLTNFISGIITKFADFRNTLLEGALGSPLGKLAEKFEKIAGVTGKASDKMKDYEEVVKRVMRGDFGNGQERWDKLTEAGYDWAHVQNLVNEKMGVSLRRLTELNDAQTDETGTILKLSDAKLKDLGFTDAEIKAYRELEEQSEKTGIPIKELIKDMDQLDGRTLLINSFKNAAKGLASVFGSIKSAWIDIFPPKSMEERSQDLYNLIAGLHKLSEKMKSFLGDADTIDKLTRSFKGLFAAIDIITTVTGGAFKFAFEAVKTILAAFDLDILDVTANIGDAIVKLRDWIDENNAFAKAIEFVVPFIKKAVDAIKSWIETFKESHNISGDMISGLINGLSSGIGKVVTKIRELGTKILETIKGVLGIHSPSTEFFAIGEYAIEGFVEGLKSAAEAIWETLKAIGKKAVEIMGEIDFGALLTVGLGGGALMIFNKFANAFAALAGPAESIGDILEGVGRITKNAAKTVKAFTGVLKSISWNIKAEALKSIAIALAILVGSFALLTLLDPDRMLASLGVMVALATILGVLSVSMSKFGAGGSVGGVAKFALLIVSLGAAMLMLSSVVKKLGGMDASEFEKAFFGLIALSGVITGLVAATRLAGPAIGSVGGTILKISLALLLLTAISKILAGMTWDEMGKAAVGIFGFVGIVASLVAISNLAGNKIGGVGPTILKISAALLLLTIVSKLLAGMSWSDYAKAAVGLAGLSGIITGLIAATKLAGSDIDKVGGTILKISIAMLLLTIVSKLIAGMEWSEMAKAAVGITVLGGIITGLIAATRLASDKDLKRLGTTLIAISVAIAILAGVASLLGMLSIEHLTKGIVAVGILSGMMALMIAATRGATQCVGTIVAMTVAIVALAVAAAALSMIDIQKLAGATAVISALMGMFALMTYAAGSMKTTSLGGLIVLVVALVAMAGALYLLSDLPIESTIGTAAALSMLILSLSGAVAILGTFGGSAGKALLGVLALTAMAVPLLAFVGVLYLMQDIDVATKNVAALVALATIMSLLLIPLTLVGSLAASALLGVLALTTMAVPLLTFIGVLALMENINIAETNALALAGLATVLTLLLIPLTLVGALIAPALLGVLALTTMAVPLLAFVGILALMENLDNATENANVLTTLLTTITAMLVVLAIVGPLALVGVAAVAALTTVMTAIGVLAVAVGALMEEFPALETFLDKGIGVLEKLAYAMGSLISHFGAGLTAGLPDIGTNLSEFMTNAKPFVDGVKMVDETALNGIKTLASAIVLLTAADLIEGITSFLSGGESFATLGTELSQFITNAKPFIDGAKTLDESALAGVKNLAESILILTGTGVVDALASWLTGGNSLADFGEEIAAFAPYIVTYSEAVKGIDAEAVEASANAAKSLSELAANLPNSGGLAGWFAGENDLSTFGEQLVPFGLAMTNYSLAVQGLDADVVVNSVTAANALSELANSLPNSGGLAGWFAGENDLSTFGANLVSFGSSIMLYSATVKGLDLDVVTNSITAANALSELSANLPNSGGLAGWFAGENDLSTFGANLVAFGSSIVSYSDAVTGLDIDSIHDSVRAARALSKMAEDLPESGGLLSFFSADKDLSTFGSQLVKFGKYLKNYGDEIVGLDIAALVNSTSQLSDLIGIAKDVEGVDFGGLSSFGKALGKLGKSGVDKFIDAFDNSATDAEEAGKKLTDSLLDKIAEQEPEAIEAGENLMTAIADGIENSKSSVLSAFTSALATSITTVKGFYDNFYSAGSYLVSGFAAGISANTFKAQAKAAAMAKAAAASAEKALDINSPSRVFFKIGAYASQGFINAFSKYESKSFAAGSDIATASTNGLSKAISRVKDMVESDIDAQPTIRPVLDLSDVVSGSRALNNMLGVQPSIGVLSSVGAINSMMNNRRGSSNDDIISAINNLGKNIQGHSGDSYNVNGVSYDDGSNVADAVKSLVRAVKIERRI